MGFVSLGCAKNLVDSQVMAGHLLSGQIRLARSPEEAEVVIVNTCAFIEEARVESMDSIRSVCQLKKNGRCLAVLVAGCLSQRYRDSLREQLPDVDAFIGIDEIDQVADIVRRLAGGGHGIYQISPHVGRLFEPAIPGIVFTGGPYAYLKIAEGCNHHCTFCAIPGIRGEYRSRTIPRIVDEAERLLHGGVKELNLISQDIMAYGSDLGAGAEGPSDLPGLLRALGGIGGRFWIRLLYGYVAGITPALIRAMQEVPQVCHYLDIPIQHSHPEILRAMGRSATVEPVRHMVRQLREAIPDMVLRTTCLVGFPGETEEQFQDLLAFVEESHFDHLGAFAFSPEEGTPAFRMAGRLPQELVEERRGRLLTAQQRMVTAMGRQRIGQRVEILLERPEPADNNVWVGRSYRQAPEVDGVTFVESVAPKARAGDFVTSEYTAAAEYDMAAEAIGEA